MAIDYSIELDCRVRARFTRPRLVELLKQRMILDLIEVYVDHPKIAKLIAVPAGAQVAERQAATHEVATRLRAETDVLDAYRADCSACPANAFPSREWEVGGCVGFLTLPVERKLEDLWAEFVGVTALATSGRPEPSWFGRFRECAGTDLALWPKLRACHTNGEPDFFGYGTALTCIGRADNGRPRVTTDALCEFLFRSPEERPAESSLIADFCTGFTTHLSNTCDPVRLDAMLEASRSVEDFWDFCSACRTASDLGLSIRTGPLDA
jgi:hypothetical protein